MTLLDPGAWTGKIYLDGWTSGSGGTRPVMEPATGGTLGEIGMASAEDVARATARAAEAQVAWAATDYEQRAAIMRRVGDLFLEHEPELQDWMVRETGSIPPKAGVEIWFGSRSGYDAAGMLTLPYGELLRTKEPHLSLARRVPIGVVGVIAPFNYPLILAVRAVAPALALGNAVVLKPDPRTSVAGGVSLARIFEEAGVPAGVFSVLPGGADVGEALVTDPNVGLISFTGSTAVGRRVGALAGEHLKRIHLELGGNSALIILDDADIDRAASVGAWGSFLHQGQICMTTGRHLVARSVADRYVEALAEHASHLPVGNPATEQVALGPIIDEKQRDKIHELVTASTHAGARVAAGGTYEGLFYRPTVLADVPESAPAYREEVFGPVAPVVAFDDIDEAVRLASDSPYGLSLGILTGDVLKALALADRIPTGIVHINDQTIGDEVTNPFGGVRDTGGARIGGAAGNIETFTTTQWVTMRSEPPEYPF